MLGKRDKYESVEVLFKKDNELEIDLYKFLEDECVLINKSTYIKQLILKEMKRLGK